MAIKGKTFDLQTITAKDDGALYRTLAGYMDWCLTTGSGTFLSITSNTMTIAECFMMIAGRYIHIQNNTELSLGSIPTTATQGRVIFRVDISQSASQLVLNQIETEIETTTSGGAFRDLVVNNINADNGGSIYEVEFCRFTCTSGSASSPVRSMMTTSPIGSLQAELSNHTTSLTTKANAGLSTPTETDFNNIQTAGWYWIDSSVTTSNQPTANNGVLEVIRSTGNTGGVILQRYHANTSVIYERLYSNSTWASWQIVPFAPVSIENGGTGATILRDAQYNLQSLIASAPLLPNNSDLNNYFVPSIYRIGTSASAGTMTNLPETNSGKLYCFWLTNQTENGGYSAQWFFPNGKSYYYYRTRQGATTTPSAWSIVGQGGIVKVRFKETYVDSPYTIFKIQDSVLMSGQTFGTYGSNYEYFSLPAGTYRMTIQVNVAVPYASSFRIYMSHATDPTQIYDAPAQFHQLGQSADNWDTDSTNLTTNKYCNCSTIFSFEQTEYFSLIGACTKNSAIAIGQNGYSYVIIERLG